MTSDDERNKDVLSLEESKTEVPVVSAASPQLDDGIIVGGNDEDDGGITDDSDLSDLSRRIWIVTTAGLPWMTGTAVNPLLRALSLAEHRSKYFVTLMIPWLASAEARTTLYGVKHVFESPNDQEAWIRKYCVERCNCTEDTASKLQIQFWNGVYHESFGSIFPLDDICSTIPREEADICILEEPEHLNWFRVPAKSTKQNSLPQPECTTATGTDSIGFNSTKERTLPLSNDVSLVTSSAVAIDDVDIELLGWSHKFRHVVGILHTNYSDYIRQYGMASLVTAPALNALSSLVIKAYCHRVIRLSATLPHLDATKEVTSNVHGVRHEFLERPDKDLLVLNTATIVEDENAASLSPVYFIGKLIWAKGFEYVLELQERFKEETGDYFPIDIYGVGKDENDIKAAFLGRYNTAQSPTVASSDGESDQKVTALFGCSNSLRDQLIFSSDGSLVDDDYVLLSNTTTETREVSMSVLTSDTADAGIAKEPSGHTEKSDEASKQTARSATLLPLDVLGDLSGKTMSTTVDTADATIKVIESVMQAGLNAISGCKDRSKTKESGEATVSPKMSLPFHIAPAKTRFKWRRNALPARFLGVQDHIVVRDILEQKVFLNMSTSEVLCTTTAEALAMGKFVVLPKHPSNEFFLQFPNCLAYAKSDEVVQKLQYAMENVPEPLSASHVRALSWEGATDRLVEAAAISKRESITRAQNGLNRADEKSAQFHVEAGKKSDWLRAKILK